MQLQTIYFLSFFLPLLAFSNDALIKQQSEHTTHLISVFLIIGIVSFLYYRQIKKNEKISKELDETINEIKHTQERTFDLPISIAVFDLQMNYLSYSKQWLKDHKLHKNTNIKGKNHFKIFPQIDEVWSNIYKEALKGKTFSKEDDPFKKENSPTQYISWEVKPWRYNNGQIGGIVVTSYNNTKEFENAKLKDDIEKILEFTPTPIIYVNEEGVIARRNKAFVNLFGYHDSLVSTKEEWFSKAYPNKDYREKVINKWNKLIDEAKKNNTNYIQASEYNITCNNNKVKVMSVDGVLHNNGFIATFQDITKLKDNEKKINIEKSRYQNLMSLSSDAVFIICPITGKLQEYSHQTKKYLGYTDKEMKNLTVLDWDKDIKSIKEFKEIVNNINHEPVYLKRVHTKKDGSTYIAGITAVRIKIEKEEIFYASVRDMTELLTLKNEKDALLQINTAGIAFINDRKFAWVNDKFNQLLGYKNKELIGENTLIVYKNKEEYLKMGEFLDENFRLQKKPFLEIKLKKKDGTFVDVNFAVNTINNNPKEVIGVFIDISEKIKALNELQKIKDETQKVNEKLKKTQEKLIKSNQINSEFLSNMSHEIRTPITGIIGITNLLIEDGCTPKQEEYLSIIKNSSNSLKNIINDILNLSKIEAGKFNISNSEFSLRKLLENLENLFISQKINKKLDFSISINDKIKDTLIGDSLRLNQVLSNLLSNSFKFTNKGYIRLNISEVLSDDQFTQILFCIEDTGIGMNELLQEKVFESFTQGELSNTKEYEGTGLGLTISQKLVNLMNGKIWFESKEAVGTKFYIQLKFKYLDKPLKKEINRYEYIKLRESKKALVVEDNEINQIVIKRILKRIGFEIIIAKDGYEGLKKAQNDYFDMIFMDIQMPNMDGYEATKKIREFNKEVPIIALSAATLKNDVENSLISGMNAHIAKPINTLQLHKIIANYFDIETIDEQKKNEKSISTISGIDVNKLNSSLANDIKSVNSILKKYYNSYNDIDKKLLTLSPNTKEFNEFIHKLKGVSGNIYANKVFDICVVIERSKNTIEIKELLKNLESEVLSITNSVKSNINKDVKLNQNKQEDNLKQILKDLIIDIENASFVKANRFDHFISLLKNKIKNDKIEEIQRYFSAYDYDKLIKQLKDIQKQIDDKNK